MPVVAELVMDASALDDLRRRVTARYADRFARGYVRSKLRRDPVQAAVLSLAAAEPMGTIVDLGCGRGQLALSLLDSGLADSVTGIDWDERLLSAAEQAADGLPATFIRDDLRNAAVPAADTVMIIDVLVQMPVDAQLAVLRRMAAAARRRIIIRAFDPNRGWRSRVGLAMEGGLWAFGAYRRASIRPLPIETIIGLLAEAGFDARVAPCWQGTPLPNVLITAGRRAVV